MVHKQQPQVLPLTLLSLHTTLQLSSDKPQHYLSLDLDGGFDDVELMSGQIGVTPAQWPFLQTLDFTLENIDIKLEQAGTDEVVSLKHDNDDIDDYSSVELDRNSATYGAEVHLTITDQALNIDPTTEDVVMFKVDSDYGVSFKATTSTGIIS